MRLADPTRTGERNEQESRRDGGSGRNNPRPHEKPTPRRACEPVPARSRHPLLARRRPIRHAADEAADGGAFGSSGKCAARSGAPALADHCAASLNAIVGNAAWHSKQSIFTDA